MHMLGGFEQKKEGVLYYGSMEYIVFCTFL